MSIRVAVIADIEQMQFIRNAVKENALSNPDLVKDKDYETYLNRRGKGWVYEINGLVVGFAIVDLQDNNVWALFIHPDFERKGIGLQLHKIMLDWYFTQTTNTIWLSTAFNTRAEKFYHQAGWKEVGTYREKEIKFEMTYNDWEHQKGFIN